MAVESWLKISFFTLATATEFKYNIFFHVAHYTFLSVILNFLEVEVFFGLSFISITVSVVFGRYCISSCAIILIIKRDNPLLNRSFGSSNDFQSSIRTYFFSPGMPIAKFWPKNLLFKKIIPRFLTSSLRNNVPV